MHADEQTDRRMLPNVNVLSRHVYFEEHFAALFHQNKAGKPMY